MAPLALASDADPLALAVHQADVAPDGRASAGREDGARKKQHHSQTQSGLLRRPWLKRLPTPAASNSRMVGPSRCRPLNATKAMASAASVASSRRRPGGGRGCLGSFMPPPATGEAQGVKASPCGFVDWCEAVSHRSPAPGEAGPRSLT